MAMEGRVILYIGYREFYARHGHGEQQHPLFNLRKQPGMHA